jgi:hypothetical protein
MNLKDAKKINKTMSSDSESYKFFSLNQFIFSNPHGPNKPLGKGSFATVHLVTCKKTRKQFAMKIVRVIRLKSRRTATTKKTWTMLGRKSNSTRNYTILISSSFMTSFMRRTGYT